jgi:benzylsuccinate CoA-transferase BbsF subunit
MPEPLLQGLRVVDMGWVWAGAVAGQLLAEWGADVIKIESTKRLDPARQGRPIRGDAPDPEQNPMFHNANRRKRSVTLDIRTPKGRDLVLRLVAISDVVIENMTPHALRDARLDYAALSDVNPRIVMLSHPLAGQTGPFRELRGYGPTAGSLVGLDAITGYDAAEEPMGFTHAVADPTVGVQGAFAVLAALRARERSGRGQHIDMSMWESLASYMAYGVLDFQLNGRPGGPRGNEHPLYAPHGLYPCADGDEGDQWIAIVVGNDEEWASLVRAMGEPEWARASEYEQQSGRRAYRAEIDAHLGEWTRSWEKLELEGYLQEHGVAATACRGQHDRYLDPHLRAREVHVDVEHPVLGTEPLYGNPLRMLRHQPARMHRAPTLGEHSREVLTGLLGISNEEYEQLEREGVLS